MLSVQLLPSSPVGSDSSHLRTSCECALDVLAGESGLRCSETAGVKSKRSHGLRQQRERSWTFQTCTEGWALPAEVAQPSLANKRCRMYCDATISLLPIAESQSDPETIKFRIRASQRQLCVRKAAILLATDLVHGGCGACFKTLAEVAQASCNTYHVCCLAFSNAQYRWSRPGS